MPVGTSDGQLFASGMDERLGIPITGDEQASEKPTGALNAHGGYDPTLVDRTHHVPLVASALTDDEGTMYGMAIDHRIPENQDYEKHLWDHEAFENEYMNHLTKIGYNSQDAYHKAHDWSTARESAAVQAEYGEQGLEDYKQHWRDASSIAKEPTDAERHPDAHTTRHALDESELGAELKLKEQDKLQSARDFVEGIKEPFAAMGRLITGQSQDVGGDVASAATNFMPDIKLGVFAGMGARKADMAALKAAQSLAANNFNPESIWKATKWFLGVDNKWRYEIPSQGAKTTLPEVNEEGGTTLGRVLDFPELYKAYPDIKYTPIFYKDFREQYVALSNREGITIDIPALKKANINPTALLLHEVQHRIQDKEGFDLGTTPGKESAKALALLYNKMHEHLKAGDSEGAREVSMVYNDFLKVKDKMGNMLYLRNPGEREALLTELRHQLPKEYIEKHSPMKTLEQLEKGGKFPLEFRYPE